jgi:hypothetical protein
VICRLAERFGREARGFSNPMFHLIEDRSSDPAQNESSCEQVEFNSEDPLSYSQRFRANEACCSIELSLKCLRNHPMAESRQYASQFVLIRRASQILMVCGTGIEPVTPAK